MLRELFKSKKFVIGLSLFLIGISVLYLRPGMDVPRRTYSIAPANRSVFKPDRSGLKKEIDRRIDRIISLIDEIIE